MLLNVLCQKIKYTVDFTVRCPECDELIMVGTHGSNGLVKHQGKLKCKTTVKRKAKEDKSKRNHTLFELGITHYTSCCRPSSSPCLDSIYLPIQQSSQTNEKGQMCLLVRVHVQYSMSTHF